MAAPDHRDLALEMFAQADVDLAEALAVAEDRAETFKLFTVVLMGEVCDLRRQLDRQRETYQRLLDEYRHLRATEMRKAMGRGAAA